MRRGHWLRSTFDSAVKNVLVIGYGNTLRGDDAVGIRAAEKFSEQVAGVRPLIVHQLTPELAVDVADAELVILFDADTTVQEVTTRVVQEDESVHPRSHFVSPSYLLTLSRELYGRTPKQMIMIAIPASSFELTEDLTAEASVRVERAVEIAREFIPR
jgi:hydrogenase maturation protease